MDDNEGTDIVRLGLEWLILKKECLICLQMINQGERMKCRTICLLAASLAVIPSCGDNSRSFHKRPYQTDLSISQPADKGDAPLTLSITNQSTSLVLLDIEVSIDGSVILDGDIDSYDYNRMFIAKYHISRGDHLLKIYSRRGGVEREVKFNAENSPHCYIAYYFSIEGEWSGVEAPRVEVEFSDRAMPML